MTFSERIIELKQSRNLLQKDIANAIDITVRNYQRYEKNEAQPTLPVLLKLADFFNVSLDYLVGRSDDPTRPLQKKGNSLITNNELHNFTNKELQYFSHEQLTKSPSELLEEIQNQNLEIPSEILEKIKNLCS